MNFLISLVIGGVIGWLASMVMNRDASMGIFWNIVVGLVGSLVGRIIYGLFTGADLAGITNAPLSLTMIIVSFVGAVVVLLIANLMQRGRAR